MVEAATTAAGGGRLLFSTGAAEQLPYPDDRFDLVVAMSPSPTIRSRGANQLARVTFARRLDRATHDPMYLVVRNVNRWDDPTATQPYGIGAALWRTEGDPELYAELEAHLEAVVELPLEIELST